MSRLSEKHQPDFTEVRKRSVDKLQLLYTVVSLAVTDMLQHFLAGSSGISIPDLSQIGLPQWFIAVSFLFTIVPFYHGASRYIDATYITRERKAQRAALLIDFMFLLIEGGALLRLGRVHQQSGGVLYHACDIIGFGCDMGAV